MKKEDIHILLDRYFEGISTLEEEQQLRDYFLSEQVAEEFRIYQAQFQFFAKERSAPKQAPPVAQKPGYRRIVLRTGIAAAACLLLFLTVKTYFKESPGQQGSYAYVNGKKYTDKEFVRIQTLESLDHLTNDNNEIISSQIEILDSLFE